MCPPHERIKPEDAALHPHLAAAAGALARSRAVLADGQLTMVALGARMAFERSVQWLEAVRLVSLRDFVRADRNIHETRAAAVVSLLDLSSEKMKLLLAYSDADEYGEDLDGTPLRYSQTHAEAAVETAKQVVQAALALGQARGVLSAEDAKIAQGMLEAPAQQDAIEHLIAAAHRGVVDGWHTPFLEDQVNFLLSATRRPAHVLGRRHAGQVRVIAAWRALGLNQIDGDGGALQWAMQATRFLRGLGERRALVEGLIVAAIAWKFLGRHREAFRYLRYAEQAAGDDGQLIQDARTQQVMTAIEVNADQESVRLAEEVRRAAEEVGDPTWVANQRMMLGRVFDAAGREDQAEQELHGGFHGQVKAHLMSRCNGMRYLMHFYARRGSREEATRWAKRLKRLAAPRGLGRHVADAKGILQARR